MIEALDKAFKDAQSLPERDQLEIAELIEQKLADMRWDELFVRPESRKFLSDLEKEAEDESGLENLENVL